MDLDDLDDLEAPQRPSKFAPKLKFQPKSRHQAKPKPEPKPETAALVVKEEKEEDRAVLMDVDQPAVPVVEEEEKKVAPQSMAEEAVAEEEEDSVVAEYDVYFNAGDSDTQLHVWQYPLRPSWRPFEMDQRCTEVRLKPKSTEVEVDLLLDTDPYNYDHDAATAEKMKKQTLSSLWRPPQATGYAVGVLMGKKLYLNPVHAVVQLRTSMEYLDSGGSKKRSTPDITVKAEGSSSAVPAGLSRKQSEQMAPEEVESWIPLKYHSSTSDLSERYLRKLVTEESNPLEFPMSPYDYLNSLCPGTAINKVKSRMPSKRYLLSLPLDKRLKTWLVEGPHVQRFTAIKHLALEDPVEDVLRIIQEYAVLVQGLWVAKPRIRCPNASNENLSREFALLLFSRSPVFKDSELDLLGSLKSSGKAVIREVAIERAYCKDWKFKEPTDVSFIKLYPDVVEQQRKLWEDREKGIMVEINKRLKRGASLKSSSRSERSGNPLPSSNSSEGSVKATDATHSARMSMSKETREALPKILRKLFQTHKVCSFQTICQGLRDMAVSISHLPKADARAAMAAASSVEGPQEELQAVINEVAVYVHGVYVWKSSDLPEFNPLRNVVIEMFRGSGQNAKLKRGEIIEAAKIKLKKEPTNTEFQKVMSEICVSKGGAWMLKSGDGVPK